MAFLCIWCVLAHKRIPIHNNVPNALTNIFKSPSPRAARSFLSPPRRWIHINVSLRYSWPLGGTFTCTRMESRACDLLLYFHFSLLLQRTRRAILSRVLDRSAAEKYNAQKAKHTLLDECKILDALIGALKK